MSFATRLAVKVGPDIDTEVPSLLNIPYKQTQPKISSKYTLDYSPHSPRRKDIATPLMSDEEVLQQFCKYSLIDNISFVPERLQIRGEGSEGGKEDSRRILLLSENKLLYKVLGFSAATALSGAPKDEDVSMS